MATWTCKNPTLVTRETVLAARNVKLLDDLKIVTRARSVSMTCCRLQGIAETGVTPLSGRSIPEIMGIIPEVDDTEPPRSGR
jgi:hypothetical protein